MGGKKKTGKARRDKFYHLAKESGYRARSAFKLIQLNRKFQFLEKSRVCIDLCAAPGGWCQVAANTMPVSSIIVGIDLVSIKPIPRVTTQVNDITSDKCRADLKKELSDWKADVVLNDGAPNVGMNWLQDAFSQAGLTLHAMKLASEFLRKGGWFVTKVFRSQDYHALVWVFKQLFDKVHATKPQASRNESAEIFVVCQGYKAPDKLDPKFLDPKAVFKQIEETQPDRINLYQPAKTKKRKAHGYAEGDYTQHAKLPVSDFITHSGFLDKLAEASELVFDEDRFLKHPATTNEIKECCKDIKLLGKGDIKSLLSWRKKIIASLKAEEPVEEEPVEEVKEQGSSDEGEVDEEIRRLRAEDEQSAKLKKKKAAKVKSKLRDKMNLKMIHPGDRIEEQGDINLFDLKRLKTKSQLDQVELSDDGELEWESDNSDADAADMMERRQKYEAYNRHETQADAWMSDSEEEIGDDDDMDRVGSGEEDSDKEHEKEERNPLLAEIDTKTEKTNKQMNVWFNKQAFEDLDNDNDDDYDMEQMITDYKEKGGTVTGDDQVTTKETEPSKKKKKTNKKTAQTTTGGSAGESDMSSEDSSDSDTDSQDSDYAEMYDKKKYKDGKVVDDDKEDMEVVAQLPIPKLDAEGLALATKMLRSKKTKRDMIDDSYNRYAFLDDNLPNWFMDDEKKHTKKQLPVTRAEVQEYKDRMKAVNARPIKKIAEAKGRKRRRMLKRLEKARKKADALDGGGMDSVSEKEKWQQIKSIYKKATKQKKEPVTYVVAKRGAGKKVSRPAGVKGRFKVVDKRQKKDDMRKKKNEKSGGKGKGNKKR